MRYKLLLLLLSLVAALSASTHSTQTGVVTLDTANPVVMALTPTGGTVRTGDTVDITWTAADNHPQTYPIRLSWREGESYGWQVISSYEMNDSLFCWTVPQAYTGDAQVQVTMTDSFGNEASHKTWTFSIIPGYNFHLTSVATLDTADPVVTITCPTADSVFVRGDPLPVEWSTVETNIPDGAVNLCWRRNASADWDSIAVNEDDDGAYDWITPADSTAAAQVRVASVDAFGNIGMGMSEPFTILQPMASFTADVTSGFAPLTVQFTDTSIGDVTSWNWDFNSDGIIDSEEQNPVWTYLFPWDYTVTLTVTFSNPLRRATRRESDSEVRIDYIQATIDPATLIEVPDDYSTIQAAIDAAGNGDCIVVSDGIYFENLEIVGKEITLASEYYVDGDTLHIDNTIIDGSQLRDRTVGSVISILPGTNPNLESLVTGFTITHGSGRTITQTQGDQTIQKRVGGGLYIESSDPVITKNKIIENEAEDEGGGSYAYLSVPNFGGGIEVGVVNPGGNLFNDNFADAGNDMYFEAPDIRDALKVENCDFEVFCSADTTRTAYWTTTNVPIRYSGSYGSTEVITSDIWVAIFGSDTENDGCSPESPFLTIDHALSLAYGTEQNPVVIHLEAGVYAPSQNGERFPLQMVDWVSIEGSGVDETYIDAEATTGNPNRVILLDHVIGCQLVNLTIIGGVVTEDKGVNGAGIAAFSSSVQLESIALNNMTATGEGAGAYLRNSSLTAQNLSVMNNQADSNGGGLCFRESSVFIDSSMISANSSNCGGGVYASGGNFGLFSSSITDNNTTGDNRRGGGVYITASDTCRISGSIVQNNVADYGAGMFLQGIISFEISCNRIVNNLQNTTQPANGGGGVYWSTGNTGRFVSNLVANNTAYQGGGFFGLLSPEIEIANNTIANNLATYKGGGFYLNASSPAITNTIIWGNQALSSGDQVFLQTNSSDPDLLFCDVQGGSAAFALSSGTYTGFYNNNSNLDPQFMTPTEIAGNGSDALLADWSLQEASPCRDAGDPATVLTELPFDIDGNPRISNLIIDQGAWEYQVIPSPDSPQNITIYCVGGVLVVSWDAQEEAEGYRVYMDIAPDGSFDNEISASCGFFSQGDSRVSWTWDSPPDSSSFFCVTSYMNEPACRIQKSAIRLECSQE